MGRYFLVGYMCLLIIGLTGPVTSADPQVTSVFPIENSFDAPVTFDLTVQLDTELDGATVTEDTFKVFREFDGEFDASWTTDVYDFTLDQNAEVHPGELIRCTVTDGIEAQGTPVVPYVWQFRTGVSSGTGIMVDSGQNIGGYLRSTEVALGDLDGDGDLDAFVANYDYGPDKVFLNDGNGFFSFHQDVGLGRTHGVALGDLDGDGDLDAYTVNGYYASYDKVFLNDGLANFTDNGQTLASGFNRDVDLGDLDADGDLDAFIVAYPNTAPFTYINDGSGMFSLSWQGPVVVEASAVCLGDLDADGDLDAYLGQVTFNGTDKSDKIYWNNGTGGFTDSGYSLGTYESDEVALGDIDGDGDLDVVTCSSECRLVTWTNSGTGFMTEKQNMWASCADGVALGDLDNDNDLDMFWVAESGPDQIWFNDGAGVFTESGQDLTNPGSGHVGLGDLNGDGSLDAYSPIEYDDDHVWLNDPPPTPSPTATVTPSPLPTETPTPEPTMTPTATPPCFNTGDTNLNGVITSDDAQQAFYIVLGLYSPTFEEECAADCNGSGSVTAEDAQTIFYTILGLDSCADPLIR